MANNKLKGSLLNLQTQRNIAKIGMGVSLGVVTLTAFSMKNRFGKGLHIVAGAALVGFSLYHYGLYNDGIFQNLISKSGKKRRLNLKNEQK
ncbi:helicase [Campylobacter curvus]|uniref:helicase n=1 Tax=Campylobacter curvus TaxID=200 RepID=UPI0014701515|nr:helicase [Campylobacter curvus]